MSFSKLEIDQLSFDIVGAAIEVQRIIGPGALESVYEACLMYELKLRHIQAVNQTEVPIIYKGIKIEKAFRLDIFVEDTIIIELQTVDCLIPVHEAQLLSYMRLLEKPKGLLLNFKSMNITKSMQSFVNEYYAKLS